MGGPRLPVFTSLCVCGWKVATNHCKLHGTFKNTRLFSTTKWCHGNTKKNHQTARHNELDNNEINGNDLIKKFPYE